MCLKDPVFHLNRVGELVGAEKKFKQVMLPKKGHGVGMKGKYKYSDVHKDEAKQLLKKFFARPNRELYQLLDSHKHGHYTHFEPQISAYLTPNNTPNANQTQSVDLVTMSHRGSVSDLASVSLEFDNSFAVPGTLFFGLLSIILLLVVLWQFLLVENDIIQQLILKSTKSQPFLTKLIIYFFVKTASELNLAEVKFTKWRSNTRI